MDSKTKRKTTVSSSTNIMDIPLDVDYDDVLHLYRGWRNAENQLKDKNKELTIIKNRVKLLQNSHIKFRGQIQALDTVKDLTITLQSEIAVLKEENSRLKSDNRELTELNNTAEVLLRERMDIENAQNRQLRNVQADFNALKSQYERITEEQRDLEALAADEQAMRMSAEARLNATEEALDKLRSEDKVLKMNYEAVNNRLSDCDRQLENASEQLSKYSVEMQHLSQATEKNNVCEATIGILKGDIARLLRLLEHYPAAAHFVRRWQDSEGLSFMGIGSDQAVESSGVGATTTGNRARSIHKVMRPSTGCSIDSDNFSINNLSDADAWSTVGLSADDLARLKKNYNMDPFPLPSSFDDELTLWVPQEAAAAGMKFLTSKIPHAPPNVIMDFLRKMNKIWLRREVRKMNEQKEEYEKRMTELRRRANNAKPYRKVVGEKQVKRLKSALIEERSRWLNGKAKRPSGGYNAWDDFDESDAVSEDAPPHEHRLCLQHQSDAYRGCHHDQQYNHYSQCSRRKANITAVSTEKLLEASLVSLETIGRQQVLPSGRASASADASGPIEPSTDYLRGALWLGRNMVMIAEELAEAMIYFRSKHVAEVTAAANDSDVSRSNRRLSLLASAGVTEAVALANATKNRAREILHDTNEVMPGDRAAFTYLLKKLPIDNAIATASGASTPYRRTNSTPTMSPQRY